jgi:hypothetical protein
LSIAGSSFAPGPKEVADQVQVSDAEVTGFTSYHPLVRSNSRIQIPELVTKFLDLLLGSL